MNEGIWSIAFWATTLIIGLNDRFADCLIEHSDYKPEKIVFEMEFFKYFKNIYHKCQTEYQKDEALNETNYWNDDKDMESGGEADSLAVLLVVQYIALENSVAFLRGYAFHKEESPEIAKKCMDIFVYLAAFGADPETGMILYNELKTYIYINKSEKTESSKRKVFTEKLPYEKLVNEIRNIFSHYNPEDNTLQIEQSDLDQSFQILNSYMQPINSYLMDTLFAKLPFLPGISKPAPYNITPLWQSTLESQLITAENTTQTDANEGESPKPREVIELLQKIEILKIRLSKRLSDDEINKIKNGFVDDSILKVHLIQLKNTEKYIIFSKYNKKDMIDTLANGNKFHNLIQNTDLGIKIETLRKT